MLTKDIKVKVDTRISPELLQQVKEIAASKYDGNFSLALRKMIEEGVSVAKHKDWSKE